MTGDITPETIEQKYRRLGYKLGWRFLYCPQRVLETAELAVLGLNPAGSIDEPDHPRWSNESGSSYVIERWANYPSGASPLQRQVQRMLKLCKVEPENALSGNFIPFRSPDWSSLDHQSEALAFGLRLWRPIFSEKRIRTVILVGKNEAVVSRIKDILDVDFAQSIRVGWADYTMETYRGNDGRLLIVLPHLSRFQIFGRENGFDGVFAGLVSEVAPEVATPYLTSVLPEISS